MLRDWRLGLGVAGLRNCTTVSGQGVGRKSRFGVLGVGFNGLVVN